MGSGGINMIVDVIVSDLVPLRERGNFMAIVLTVYFIGTSIGPFVGGAIVEILSWRWVFYINLPVRSIICFAFWAPCLLVNLDWRSRASYTVLLSPPKLLEGDDLYVGDETRRL